MEVAERDSYQRKLASRESIWDALPISKVPAEKMVEIREEEAE